MTKGMRVVSEITGNIGRIVGYSQDGYWVKFDKYKDLVNMSAMAIFQTWDEEKISH